MTFKVICAFVLAALTATAQFWGGGQEKNLLSESKPIGVLRSAKGEYITLPAGGTLTVLDYTGDPGYVSAVWLGIENTTTQARNESIFKVTVDGEPSPGINIRLPLFFAAEYQYNQQSFTSRFIGASNNNSNNVGFQSYIPIPFSSSVKIDVTNGSGTTAGKLWYTISYHTGVPNRWPRTKKLKVASETLTGLVMDQVVPLVDVSTQPKGRLLGVFMSYDGYPGGVNPRTAPQEGNVKIYLDGAASPNFESSSFEDYFQMSNYFQGYTSPAVSAYIGVTLKSADSWNAHRFHILDPIVFKNALKITWNCGDSTRKTFTGTARLAYTVWYYTE